MQSSRTCLLPPQKLIEKQRIGSRVIEKHDQACTPHQRAIAHPAARKRPIITMNAGFERVRPAALSRQIMAFAAQLEALAQAKQHHALPEPQPPLEKQPHPEETT